VIQSLQNLLRLVFSKENILKQREDAVLLIYGEGGHRAEMANLYNKLKANYQNKVKFVGVYENKDCLNDLALNINLPIMRDKYSRIKSAKNIFINPLIILKKMILLQSRFHIKVIITTGPGLCIIPSIFFKIIKGVKIIYIENSCRFLTRSLGGRVMYLIADKFYVQNESLLKLYKNAEYCGQLL